MDVDDDLLADWFHALMTSQCDYIEPHFDEVAYGSIRNICKFFTQDEHIFVLATDILERFASRKHAAGLNIGNEMWTCCACVHLANKAHGCVTNPLVRFNQLEQYAKDQTGTLPDHMPNVKQIEEDIMFTLDFHIPLTSRLDDTKVVAEKLRREYHLPESFLEVCVKSFVFMWILWKYFFYEVKAYFGDEETFRATISKKMFIPIGISVAALRLCHYGFNFDVVMHYYSIVSGIEVNRLTDITNLVFTLVESCQL